MSYDIGCEYYLNAYLLFIVIVMVELDSMSPVDKMY